MRSISILILLFVTLSIPASASDGVLEINQTCAIQTGCFSGDAAGLPVTITTDGSYRLTSNIVVLNENTSGILISGDDVSIDLANGNRGINGASGSIISGNSVCRNRFYGIAANSSTVSGDTVTSNKSDGIAVGNGSTVRGNTVRDNIGFGLLLFSQSGYLENVMTGNTAGAVSGVNAVDLGNNACNGSTTCP